MKGDRIPTWVSLCSLADVFDALTTNRPYKNALTPFKALQVMCNEMVGQFDGEMLAQFIVLLGPRGGRPASRQAPHTVLRTVSLSLEASSRARSS